MSTSSGKLANDSGIIGECVISDFFESKKIKIMSYSQWNKTGCVNVLVSQFPFTNIYGRGARIDFAYINKDGKVFGIEAKRQNVPGSVDEKIPFVMFNSTLDVFEKLYCVVSGNHWNDNAAIVRNLQDLSKATPKFTLLTECNISQLGEIL